MIDVEFAKGLIINGYRYAWYEVDVEAAVVFYSNTSTLSDGVVECLLRSVVPLDGVSGWGHLNVDRMTGGLSS